MKATTIDQGAISYFCQTLVVGLVFSWVSFGTIVAEEIHWSAAIDSVWGEGLSASDKLEVYEEFWRITSERGAVFRGSGVDWDSVWIADSTEIAGGVSRGRFSAILNYASLALRDYHTKAWNKVVYTTAPAPGVPLLSVGAWAAAGHFGAALTPLPDSSLLVYEAVASHPLGLVPGDIVLGYDGVLYKDLFPQLLAAELPIRSGGWWGGSDASWAHSWLKAAGMNWHLFDSIDVVRYATGDTVRLATNALDGQNMSLLAPEQLDVAGVAKPTIPFDSLTWGIVDSTNIGYIYIYAWPGGSTIESKFFNAVDSLMIHLPTTGIIVDLRFNSGGLPHLAHKGLELLFNTTVDEIKLYERGDPNDRDSLVASTVREDDYLFVYGDTATYYDKPIAVLTGPGCLSAGEQVALALSYHPMVKFFGKPTAGAFSGQFGYFLHTNFSFTYSGTAAYRVDDPGTIIVRKEFPSASFSTWVEFEEVWFTPEGVAAGVDDVVEAAKAWIVSSCPVGLTGDVNVSGSITSADIIYLVGYVFKDGPSPLPCEAAGDANCSKAVTSADIIYLVNHVFKSGPVPCNVCTLIPGAWPCF